MHLPDNRMRPQMTWRRVSLVLTIPALVVLASWSSGGWSSSSVPPSSVTMGYLTEVFATPLPSDPAQAKVIADFRQAMILWDKSSEAVKMVAPVASYVTGSAVGNLAKV